MKNLLTKPLLLSALLLSVVLPSCDKDEVNPTTDSTTTDLPDEIPTVRPGGFALSRLINVPNGRSAATVPHQVKFDLGDIKASREFLFLLANSGDVPVFDISITTDHPQFEVSPHRIDTLGVNGSTNNLLPLVSVGIKHGVALNGVGQVDLLEKGANTGTVSITGKTIVADDTVEVKAEVEMRVEAKVADIDVYINGNLLDLYQRDFKSIGPFDSNGYSITLNSEIKIVNVGNVPIQLTYYNDSEASEKNDVLLKNGESVTFNARPGSNIDFMDISLIIDGGNTIMKHKKILQGEDGRGYITFHAL